MRNKITEDQRRLIQLLQTKHAIPVRLLEKVICLIFEKSDRKDQLCLLRDALLLWTIPYRDDLEKDVSEPTFNKQAWRDAVHRLTSLRTLYRGFETGFLEKRSSILTIAKKAHSQLELVKKHTGEVGCVVWLHVLISSLTYPKPKNFKSSFAMLTEDNPSRILGVYPNQFIELERFLRADTINLVVIASWLLKLRTLGDKVQCVFIAHALDRVAQIMMRVESHEPPLFGLVNLQGVISQPHIDPRDLN